MRACMCGHGFIEELGLTAVDSMAIGHISEIEEPPLRVRGVRHKTRKNLRVGVMKAYFKGRGLFAFEFVDVIHNGVSAVRERWRLPGRRTEIATW